jgi:hypothetical protein
MLTSFFLIEKWKKEGRDTEMEELDAFFKRTGYKKHHVTISSNG